MATVARPKEAQERLARIAAEEEKESLFSRYYLLASAIITGLALALGWLLGRFGVIGNEVEVGFYIVAYIAGGSYPAVQSIKDLARLHVQIDLLMVTAAIGAAIIGHWTEGAILLFLFSTSNALEHYALGRTKRAVRALMDITPDQALVEHDGEQRMVHVRELEIGDVVIVRPGERIPADGRIIGGESGIDQSAITGESMPVVKRYGDDVFTGTINGHGALRISVTRLAHESTLAKIVEIVQAAQSDKSRQQRFADRFEGTYAVGVIAFSAFYFAFLTLGLSFEPADAFYRAMVLLVVASPCALVISTPASTLSALANSARQGILIKGAAQLEDIGAVRVIAFDKTGTLTVGEPRLTALEPAPGVDETELLTIAASAEVASEHPLAEAIVNAARLRELPLLESHDLRAITGKGIEATVDGRTVLIGNAKLLADYGVQADAGMGQVAASLQEDGMTVSYVAAAQAEGPVRLLGVIAVADTLRPTAAGTVARLKELGIEKTLMLSGDNERSANAIARQVGLDEVYASLLPAEKLDKIEDLKAEYGEVVMVGDGVNDAPALATASIGVAMGAAGSDAALETADIVLMADDLTKLPYVVELSRKTRRVIRQNLGFSLAVIVVLVTATLIGATNLTVGVIGHEGSTVIVVLNGLRLLRGIPTERPAALRAESLAPATVD